MCVNNLPKVATQWNSDATRDSNRGRRVLIPSALTTTPPSHAVTKDISSLCWEQCMKIVHFKHGMIDLLLTYLPWCIDRPVCVCLPVLQPVRRAVMG